MYVGRREEASGGRILKIQENAGKNRSIASSGLDEGKTQQKKTLSSEGVGKEVGCVSVY